MNRCIRSLWQGFTADNTRRLSRPCLVAVERLEDRFLLTGGYTQTNLVSNLPNLALHKDPNLLNPWGIVVTRDGSLRVADNHSGLSTLYASDGTILPRVFTIPPPGGSPRDTIAAPTGMVLNTSSDFVIRSNNKSAPSVFIFATEDGTLSGYNGDVNPTTAILTVDNSGADAVYKGLAFGSNAQGNFLYATDFHNGKIDVFDKNFHPVTLSGSFTDRDFPPPPIGHPGFAPFGIQNIGGKLFVTYALQKESQDDDQAGPGNGFVDVFDTNGKLLQRFASRGTLNSPWGMVVAPQNFGPFSGALLIGNFGDGRINAFNLATGAFLGQLSDPAGHPIIIDGLWGLTFIDNTLFFTAGLNDEEDGLFGTLRPAGGGGEARPPSTSERGGEAMAFATVLSHLPDGPNFTTLSSTAVPASTSTVTGAQSVQTSILQREDVSVGTNARNAIDQAFADFQPSLFHPVLANGLADALVQR